MPRTPLAIGLVAAALALAGCESLQRTDSAVGAITPYRIDIVQGNAITLEMAALVKPGMSKLQVRDILGTPLVTDPFHANRWDYVFSMRRRGANVEARHVVVQFDGEVVKSITAPELPSEQAFVASISRIRDVRVPKLELTEQERAALPPPKRLPTPAAEPMGPLREYPPLEKS